MKHVSTIVIFIVCLLGVFSMEPNDFRPTTIFFHYGVILITAVGWGFMVDEFIETTFNNKINEHQFD